MEEEDSPESGDEALSLSDLPLSQQCQIKNTNNNEPTKDVSDFSDFEFDSRASSLCLAEDVFFCGQILPLRPSVSSEDCSRNLSLRSDSSGTSTCFTATRSQGSSGSSSRHFEEESVCPWHTQSSPKPGLRGKVPCKVGPEHRPAVWWGVFRLGLVRQPAEINLLDLRRRQEKGGEEPKKKREKGKKEENKERKREMGWCMLGGLSCKCSATAIAEMTERRAREAPWVGSKEAGEEQARRRTFEWLKALGAGVAPEP
ncbi:hypothetical protein AMTRI_Chr12g235560 [Amborella trichopoda]|uniref:Uncharacterized protein n=1 Tax=Amborella trichopoda TaxID=13333 RepID=W1NMA5_AMBTC|nr:uncharacterized protein LOC110006379 [Amborella trichopoda]ERM96646.1 hypothetical protein AMTR_s00001p00272390 [Amborella trichopoda]|eukprot:XP_020517270.1 uncharacterized protein LOC110006379 [Amborella trichopoda]